ncbi:MAG: GNAT family N-acetyltransferase, partial [Planctomycetota bacterium]
GGVARLIGGAADTCELRKMFYRPEARGRGLGRRMLLKILDRAKEFGYKKCYIETLTRMDQAIGLYVHCGFQEIQNPMGNTGHGRCDRWFLKKLVAS